MLTYKLVEQMLTSKDTNFIGFTFKKSDITRSMESSGSLHIYCLCVYLLELALKLNCLLEKRFNSWI